MDRLLADKISSSFCFKSGSATREPDEENVMGLSIRPPVNVRTDNATGEATPFLIAPGFGAASSAVEAFSAGPAEEIIVESRSPDSAVDKGWVTGGDLSSATAGRALLVTDCFVESITIFGTPGRLTTVLVFAKEELGVCD